MSKREKATATLALLVDGVVTKEFPLDKPDLTIGRRAGNDVRLDDIAVSGQHARVTVVPNRYLEGAEDVFLEDLGSTNGTQVNGQRVERVRLNHNDLIQIGFSSFKLLAERQLDLERTRYIVQD